MTDQIHLETIIHDGDDEITLKLPEDKPHGKVRVTIQKIDDDISQEELDAFLKTIFTPENMYGQGKTAGEMLQSPAIGIWENREDITDSIEFVEEMRRKSRERRLNSD
jgi:hypothetical protein